MDGLRGASRKDLLAASDAFRRLDPNRSGVITLAQFVERWQALVAKPGKKAPSASALQLIFEAADLTSTAEVDFNE